MAEFVFKDLAEEAGVSDLFHVESAATSSEELGNPVYPPVRQLLSEKGISTKGKRARRITPSDYEEFDYIIGMDSANIRNLRRFFSDDPEGKVYKLLSFAGEDRDVDDPWYTDEFDVCYLDVLTGCRALLRRLLKDGER